MATKAESEMFQGFACPICHNIFNNATILKCGHSFCKDCLEDYGEKHIDHIVCIVCWERTELGENRVAGLTPNLSVKGLEDAVRVKVKDLSSKSCQLHKQVYKDIFCEACEDFICITCFVNNHLGHRIKKKEELERDLENKRTAISLKDKEMDVLLVRYLDIIEQQRKGIHSDLHNLEKKIRDTSTKKIMALQENEEILLKQLDTLKRDSETQSGNYTAHYRQLCDTIIHSITVLSGQTNENLDTETLKAHHLHCQKLKTSLKETINEDSIIQLTKDIENAHFQSADDKLLSLGHIEFEDQSTEDRDQQLKATSDVSREADSLCGVRRNMLNIVSELYLRDNYIAGIASLSQEAVIVGYGGVRGGSDCVFVSGEVKRHLKESVVDICDIAFLTDGRLVTSQSRNTCNVYSSQGTKITGLNYTCKQGAFSPRFCADKHDNIYAVNSNPVIYIFHGKHPDPQRVVSTGNVKPRQICVTTTGVMITSTCTIPPSTVTLFDEEGNVGSSITADDDKEYLYATVDSMDRLLVARVRERSTILRLSRYSIQGTRLEDHVTFEQINLTYQTGCSWFYMASLSPNLLALANGPCLYFMELTLLD